MVSIHAPARGATAMLAEIGGHGGVSIHAPARGATKVTAKRFTSLEFQSTPPRGGRLLPLSHLRRLCRVSIHAPARGATKILTLIPSPRFVSIHAPARGATLLALAPRSWWEFQSTPPRGGRPDIDPEFFSFELVSIHAPARGATIISPIFPAAKYSVSIHAPARGATCCVTMLNTTG